MEYCEIWEQKGWKKKGGDIKNLDLIQTLWELYNNHDNIIFEHVRSIRLKTTLNRKVMLKQMNLLI